MTLRLDQATVTYGSGDTAVTALDHVDLIVGAGELVAVVGPSGSGKSTLLAVAGGLLRPTSGTAAIGDTDLGGLSRRRLAAVRREKVGFVFQSANLLPALTARDQLRLVPTLGGTADGRDADELLAAVGMTRRAGRRPGRLSGGERQRVGIARALVNRPEVLLVDEPTAALDRQRSQDVVELLARETHQAGVATVMVTHDHDVLVHADRVLEMVDGRLGPVR